tara:strand:+ start:50 stop:1180 length:1131 start_codon:yes stop_codon:yes gene_type:complete
VENNVEIYLVIILNILILSGLVFFILKRNSNEDSEINVDDKLKQIIQQISIDNSSTMREQNISEINNTLKPFKEQLQRELDILKKNIDDQNNQSAKEFGRFEQQFQSLVAATTNMQEDAQNLTKALKGDTKQQGDWGERVLERALEDAGLVEDLEYKLQPNYKTKTGKNVRPDAVVFLTDDRNIIIDSKVSITAYKEFVSAENEDDKKNFLKSHINSIKNHVKELSEKDYSGLEEINSPDYVFMFVPIDSALTIALSNDWSIQELANEKKIAFMTPIHLMSILKMTAFMWRVNKQHKNAADVANRAGLLLDKYANFSEAFSNIAEKLEDAVESYNTAHNRLTDGAGSLHSQMKSLEKLGMKGKKTLSEPKKSLDKK